VCHDMSDVTKLMAYPVVNCSAKVMNGPGDKACWVLGGLHKRVHVACVF